MKTFAVIALSWILVAASLTAARRDHHGKQRHNPKRFNHTTPREASYGEIHLRADHYHRQLYGIYGADVWKYYVRNATLLLIRDQPPKRVGEPQGYYGCSRLPGNLDEIAQLNRSGVRWVGLVDRGDCMFYKKIQYAAELGAVGLLVRSKTDEITLMSTIGNHIPSLMIRKTVGDAIQRDIADIGNGKIKIKVTRVLVEEMKEKSTQQPAAYQESGGSKLFPSITCLLLSCLVFFSCTP